MKDESKKKQINLRISENLWKEIIKWSEDEFRSVNSQIEFLLYEAIKNRGRKITKNEIDKN